MNTCTKCKSNKVYHSKASKHRGAAKVFLSAFSSVMLGAYVCTDCGFVEHFVETKTDLEKVRKKIVRAHLLD